MYNYKDNGRIKFTEPLYFTNWEAIRLNLSPGSTASNLWEAMADPKFMSITSKNHIAQMLRADAWQTVGGILSRRGNSDEYTYAPDEFSRTYPNEERLRIFALYITDGDWMDLVNSMEPYIKNGDIDGAMSLYVQQLQTASANFSPAITPADAFTKSLRANTSKTVTGLPGDEATASTSPTSAALIVLLVILLVVVWIIAKPSYTNVMYVPMQARPVF
jgi:transposase-like protein